MSKQLRYYYRVSEGKRSRNTRIKGQEKPSKQLQYYYRKKAKLTKTDDANCSDINSSNNKSCNESSETENNLVGRPDMEMNSDTNHDSASELLLQSKAQNGLGASNISNSLS